jgi:hypothetical protein
VCQELSKFITLAEVILERWRHGIGELRQAGSTSPWYGWFVVVLAEAEHKPSAALELSRGALTIETLKDIKDRPDTCDQRTISIRWSLIGVVPAGTPLPSLGRPQASGTGTEWIWVVHC